MKSFTRACLIFSGVVISIGLVLTIIGGVLGAGTTFADMVRNGSFSFGFGNGYSISNKSFTSFNDEFKEVDELSIDLKYAELQIDTTDGDSILVNAENILEGYTCVNENGKLVIKDNITERWRIKLRNNYHPTIYLSIPKSASFKKVKIDIGAGEVIASNINTDKLSIELGAGKLEGDRITSKESEISVGAGSLVIDQFITDKIKMDCGVGRLELNGSINGDADLECGLGNITLSLTNQETDFNYDIDCGVGNVIIGNQSIGGLPTKRTIDNHAKKNVDIECGVGSIELYFNETL